MGDKRKMSEKSILEMVGGEKHINPHYNIKVEKTDKDEMNEEELFCKLFPDYVVNGKPLSPYFDLFESGFEQAEKRIVELEQKISVLLSCNNCPENKGGYICQKEYEDKCLAQKIQFIKELQEEKVRLNRLSDMQDKAVVDLTKTCEQRRVQLIKVKELLKEFVQHYKAKTIYVENMQNLLEQVEQFLNSEVEK